MNDNETTEQVIGAAIEVHRALGPGLLESIYEDCLAFELRLRAVPFSRQCIIPLEYKGHRLDTQLRADFIVNESVITELKCVETLAPIHRAQVLTYMRLTGRRLGLLINFNVPALREGICRIIL